MPDATSRRSNGPKWQPIFAEVRLHTMESASFPSSIGNLHSSVTKFYLSSFMEVNSFTDRSNKF